MKKREKLIVGLIIIAVVVFFIYSYLNNAYDDVLIRAYDFNGVMAESKLFDEKYTIFKKGDSI